MKTVLGDYASLIRGVTFKPSQICDIGDPDYVVCMRTKNIQVELDQDDLIAIPKSLVKSDDKMVSSGDVLVSSANSWNLVGKCCRVEHLTHPTTAGGFISILRSTSADLDPDYLYRWFSSARVQHRLRSFANQTTNIANLDHKRTLALPLPLPPIAEQKRIAAILDKADELRAKRKEAIAELDKLQQSVFLDMFGDPVTNPKGWETAVIADLGEVMTGNTPSRARSDYYGGGIEWIKSDNLNTDSAYATRAKEELSEEARPVARIAPSGSVLVTCIAGSPSAIGNAAIVDREVAFNQQINAVIPNDRICCEFLYMTLIVGKSLVQWKSSGGMKGLVNKSAFSSICVPVPPIEDQHKFQGIWRRVIDLRQKFTVSAELQALVSASLQSKAFKGEL